MTIDHLRQWIGRTEIAEDIAAPAPLAGLSALLDHDAPPWTAGDVPPLGHWLYFPSRARQRDISADGHPERGGFLPPVELPRRMWAGGSFEFHAPIRIGDPITRRSTVENVVAKQGRSGPMVFVKVRHDIAGPRGPALCEIHDIVYRDRPQASDASPDAAQRRDACPDDADPPPGAAWRRDVHPDIVMLFRYSALTFNGHRIHYDRDYCRDVEGYPGLVFHGPLTATMLMDLFLRRNPGALVKSFRFRALRPLFDLGPIALCGAPKPGGAALWALNPQGEIAVQAEIRIDERKPGAAP